jgi:phosphoribosyl 1,2-cyclic phosphodiesterase
MSLQIASLNSGSNGNCYYVGNDEEAVLIDAGISCREIEKRMTALQLSMSKIKAVFISHEHIDHIRGLAMLSKKYQLPVFITPGTLNNSQLSIDKALIKQFSNSENISIGNLTVVAFSKFHDAADPFSFIVKGNDVTIGIITDIGTACKNVIYYFSQCNACFLESNYDEKMLEEGDYPFHLKKRIRSGHGHLSNAEALQLYISHRSEKLTHLLLSHLSKNNNHPRLVKELFSAHAKGTNIIIASRDEASSLYIIENKDAGFAKKTAMLRMEQMSLFDA